MDPPVVPNPPGERRVNLSVELQSLRDAVADLAVAVSESFDEERLKAALLNQQRDQAEELLADQRRERNRLISFVLLGVVLLAAIGVVGFAQSRANHRVSDQIRACQTPGTPCAQRSQAAFTAAIKAEYSAIVCYVSIPVEQRTAALADKCIDDALHAGGVTIPLQLPGRPK